MAMKFTYVGENLRTVKEFWGMRSLLGKVETALFILTGIYHFSGRISCEDYRKCGRKVLEAKLSE